jgi:hypothetical protein
MADWDNVTVIRKRPERATVLKSESAVNAARRSGAAVTTEKKKAAGSLDAGTAAKVDNETEVRFRESLFGFGMRRSADLYYPQISMIAGFHLYVANLAWLVVVMWMGSDTHAYWLMAKFLNGASPFFFLEILLPSMSHPHPSHVLM